MINALVILLLLMIDNICPEHKIFCYKYTRYRTSKACMNQTQTVKCICFLYIASESEGWLCEYHALNILPGLASVPYIFFLLQGTE